MPFAGAGMSTRLVQKLERMGDHIAWRWADKWGALQVTRVLVVNGRRGALEEAAKRDL